MLLECKVTVDTPRTAKEGIEPFAAHPRKGSQVKGIQVNPKEFTTFGTPDKPKLHQEDHSKNGW